MSPRSERLTLRRRGSITTAIAAGRTTTAARASLTITLAACIVVLGCPHVESLKPLTEIQATDEELAAFTATVSGALTKLRGSALDGGAALAAPVVHVVGASGVEAAVDWQPLCEAGATIVLVGPELPEGDAKGSLAPCVTIVRSLYSRKAVADAGAPGADVAVILNGDAYMPYWRRTLAELLQSGKPVVLTMYCMFEGAQMDRMFLWHDEEFSAEALAACDAAVGQAFGDAARARHTDEGNGAAVPEARMLWEFSANPNADAEPRDCYSGTAHGVRNAWWMAFEGTGRGVGSGGEL